MAVEPTNRPAKRPLTPAESAPTKPEATPAANVKPPPFFRFIDWVALVLVFVVSFAGYLYTCAPDLTLEDSGELAVASMYAGVPHPPGYPVWTVYTWFFTKIIPFGNIAWRVAVSSAFAGALACGLIGMMVSRGSSMFIESVAEFKAIDRRTENWICLVPGFVSGLLMAFNGFFWSQAVIVEVYTISVLSLVGVLICLLRWGYAPNQCRYLYLAWFLCGIAFNNHQSLIVITLAMEVYICAVQARMGRQFLLWNVVFFLMGAVLHMKGKMSLMSGNTPVVLIFYGVGLGSMAAWTWLSTKIKASGAEIGRDLALAGAALVGAVIKGAAGGVVCVALVLAAFAVMDFMARGQVVAWTSHWRKAFTAGLAFVIGAAFYLYMPLASMTNPPLNWGYPRTAAGFIHAFTRGQYEKIHPTAGVGDNIVTQTVSWVVRYSEQFWWMLIRGSLEEFNLVYLGIGFVPLLFLRRVQARERAWLIGLVAFYIILGPFMLELLNPQPDRQSLSLNKVFFTSANVIVAMAIGHGVSFLLCALLTGYERVRRHALAGFAICAGLALYDVYSTMEETPYIVLRATAWVGLGLAIMGTLIVLAAKVKAPVRALLFVFALMPAYPILSHWSDNEQRGHLFGFWFGHDMFTPPFKGKDGKLIYTRKEREELLKTPQGQATVYPEMTKDAVLFGGTDPGRFCPTYMIFCESFIPPQYRRNPEFDRRDVYIITQNALADGTYLNYIRAHFFRSAQYQYDTPFFQDWLRSDEEKEKNFKTNLLARVVAVPLDNYFTDLGNRIEYDRRSGASRFKASDFTDLAALAKKLKDGQPAPLAKYLKDNFSPDTVQRLNGSADQQLASLLARDFNALIDREFDAYRDARPLRDQLKVLKADAVANAARIDEIQKKLSLLDAVAPMFTPARFEGVTVSAYLRLFLSQDPQQAYGRCRLNRLLLEAAYPEIAKSPGGVYPDTEIYTPSPEDSQRCFSEYMADAQARMAKGQLKPGEDVRVIDNRVQVSGQVAVMAINGLLTKVIFEKNPDREFFVEESFPLDWMYPYLTPFGIIMKINREPLRELSEEIVKKDHIFWSDYSERLIGNWITYDTTVKEITAFAERVYEKKNYTGFKGDPRFVRDEDGQKAFSKLRSSIAGVYAWRLGTTPPGTPAYERMLKEAEFSFKQAYAFCPFSPEALYRYVNVLAGVRRFDDALLLAQTSQKLDPGNQQLGNLVKELERLRGGGAGPAPVPPAVQKAEAAYRANPAFSNAVAYAQAAASIGDSGRVLRVADDIMGNTKADGSMVNFAMQIYAQLQDYAKLEAAITRWTVINPVPESFLDLAGAQAMQNKHPQAISTLQRVMAMNAARLKTDPKAANMATIVASDPRFAAMQAMPEFKALLATNK